MPGIPVIKKNKVFKLLKPKNDRKAESANSLKEIALVVLHLYNSHVQQQSCYSLNWSGLYDYRCILSLLLWLLDIVYPLQELSGTSFEVICFADDLAIIVRGKRYSSISNPMQEHSDLQLEGSVGIGIAWQNYKVSLRLRSFLTSS